MRERTPSADDTPKRAPPAPSREAASADVAGSKTLNGTVEEFRRAKLSSPRTVSLSTSSAVSVPSATATTSTATSASTTSATSTTAGGPNRMVASTHNLEDLGVSHPASASNERQQQQLQEKHGHTYRAAQTAQDKRSRLSNVINNLRKKVPDTKCAADSPRKEEDERNSVERNLETLEKYVMTVLNGVIKDEEDDGETVEGKKECEEKQTTDVDEEQRRGEDSTGLQSRLQNATTFEPSKPHESRTEAAVPCAVQPENADGVEGRRSFEGDDSKRAQGKCLRSIAEDEGTEAATGVATISKEADSTKETSDDPSSHDVREDRRESRSLGTIIMERLSEHQSEDRGQEPDEREVAENDELRAICKELLNDLLNGINQLIEDGPGDADDGWASESSCEGSREQDLPTTSLHCSLPLDKVASVLQNCQTSELLASQSSPSTSASASSSSSPTQIVAAKSPTKPPSPTVRHLCLYCDRKFLSISLRQRHTERVHQLGGGRRSERNSRKPSQNCQYCSDKCAENLEGLFQHMVGSHGDKYHACVQCSTRYLTREALVGHMNEAHAAGAERTSQFQEKAKEPTPCKEFGGQSSRDKPEVAGSKDRRAEESEMDVRGAEVTLLKHADAAPTKDAFSNPGSPEFDSSFYSNVSCNIRENLLHHLDGKLQTSSSPATAATMTVPSESKQTSQQSSPQQNQQPSSVQQQSFYEHGSSQIQFPIDISLTAATPVYNKDYPGEEYENSSEYAQKPGKTTSRSHPRRVSFEKYNFPRKYDGKEQWTCSIKDLSKFDISTQLTLRKKQQLLKERPSLNRRQTLISSADTLLLQTSLQCDSQDLSEAVVAGETNKASAGLVDVNNDQSEQASVAADVERSSPETGAGQKVTPTEFSAEFGNFLRLRRWDEASGEARKQDAVYAELTGEWSRPRIYICGACAARYEALRDMEDHKSLTHPNVWCSHFEFSGDQRELYKHLFLPGRTVATTKARNAILSEKVCTKCSKNCASLPELHRHMLECGGDQAWLLGLFGNGKKKCKWRPFGSRSRRRRQRGMKRNIQNSQTPRINHQPKEKQPSGPRVRPSDRESIQKMLANLPPKRATRKVLQDSTLRTQGRLRNVQTRSRPHTVGETSSSRISRNKAALRNKLLKNAKSIQRNRCRSDNISAVIESVVNSSHVEEERKQEDGGERGKDSEKGCANEGTESSSNPEADDRAKAPRPKVGRPRVLGKKRNVKTRDDIRSLEQIRRRDRRGQFKTKSSKMALDVRTRESETTLVKSSPMKVGRPRNVEKETDVVKSASPGSKDEKSPNGKKTALGTPKKKRPVDPVASLNASIKAKSQLRTQDGKFARNPNKVQSAEKVETRVPSTVGRPRTKSGSEPASVGRPKGRPKVRKEEAPRRTTRLSSDSDKMPTLEPVSQLTGSEEYVEKSTNDLPILSPVAPASGNPENQKTLRGKALKYANDEKENDGAPARGIDDAMAAVQKSATQETMVEMKRPEERKEPRPRGRRPKADKQSVEAKESDRSTTTSSQKNEGPAKIVKEERPRGRPVGSTKQANLERELREQRERAEELKKVTRRNASPDARRDAKRTRSLETRSNSRARRTAEPFEDVIKLQDVPIEVKKLLGPGAKEDLLTKLGLTSRDPSFKRTLRQSGPRAKAQQQQMKSKVQRVQGKERRLSDSGSQEISEKSKAIASLRKSPRTTDKKVNSERDKEKEKERQRETEDDKALSKNEKCAEKGDNFNAADEMKSSEAEEGENFDEADKVRATDIADVSSGESLMDERKVDETDKSAGEKEDGKLLPESVDKESLSGKRQTRNSADATVSCDETQNRDIPDAGANPKKNISFGKRRGRIKSDAEKNDPNGMEGLEKVRAPSTEVGKRTEQPEQESEENEEEEEEEETRDEEAENGQEREDVERVETKNEKENADGSQLRAPAKYPETGNGSEENIDTDLVNLSLSHLQLETGNSIDSGKENSLEASEPIVQKLRATRPKKSWAPRREKTSKRSLSNVIGILTEGMNIPIEMQQSVVLTVQTSVDNISNPDVLQSNLQETESNIPETRTDEINKTNQSSGNDDTNPETSRVSDVERTKEEFEQTESETLIGMKNSELTVEREERCNKSADVTNTQSPTNDIILDLSRRKTKGKGSFLEKIVSKIAKQKDALLEGEVGTLLDTAADELTSILDEVGPALSENAENGHSVSSKRTSARSVASKTTPSKQIHNQPLDSSQRGCNEILSKSTNEKIEVDPSPVSKNQNCLDDAVIHGETNETYSKNDAQCKTSVENETQKCAESERIKSVNGLNDNQTDDCISVVEKTNVAEIRRPSKESEPSAECQYIPNGMQLSIVQEHKDNAAYDERACGSSEKSERKQKSTSASDDAISGKSKRRSAKRSLEINSPKRNKRKSIDEDKAAEETIVEDEVHLSDIMKLIHKRGSGDDVDEDEDVEKVLPGKRKASAEDSGRKDPFVREAEVDAAWGKGIPRSRTNSSDANDGVKKLKPDVAESIIGHAEHRAADEKESDLGRDQTMRRACLESTNDVPDPNVSAEPTDSRDLEETDPPKNSARKSCSGNKSQDTEVVLRRVSKRNSLSDDKCPSPPDHTQDETCFKDGAKLGEIKESSVNKILPISIPRRTSSRTKPSLPDISKADDTARLREKVDATPETLNIPINILPIPSLEIPKRQEKAHPIQTTILRVPEVSKIYQSILIGKSNEAAHLNNPWPTYPDPPTTTVPDAKKQSDLTIVVPKVPKKRGRKKKSLADEHLELPADPLNVKCVSPERASSRNSKKDAESAASSASESDKESRTSVVVRETSAATLEPFKVPEVSEVLQHTKKRVSKRKSLLDEHLDLQSVPSGQDSELASANSADGKVAASGGVQRKEKQLEDSQRECSVVSSDNRGRPGRKRSQDNGERIERSSSSGSIDLAPLTRTRSSKKKQLSSEDLMTPCSQDNANESVDNWSETSCASESSYFRKKRFSKRKKDMPGDDVQTDTSVTDSESVDAENGRSRRQVGRRKGRKSVSLLEDHLDLPADPPGESSADVTLSKDTDVCAEKTTTVDDDKPITEDPAQADGPVSNDHAVGDKDEDIRGSSLTEDKEEQEVAAEDSALNETPSDTDNHQAEHLPDDFQTPKKRAAGNFVVVHTKSGEILIVEKRKKLTKEAARFFCDVCATSFTRKSSLKKHNQSQSHLVQLAKSGKEKGQEQSDCSESILESANETNEDQSWKESENCHDESTDEINDLPEKIVKEAEHHQIVNSSVPVVDTSRLDNYPLFPVPIESTPLLDPRVTRQEALEDELLDEEICKITENMSHDEYVITDHISPVQPEATSTPIKKPTKKMEDKEKKTSEKKRGKAKKKNLAEEHLELNSPVLTEDVLDTTTESCKDVSIAENDDEPVLRSMPDGLSCKSDSSKTKERSDEIEKRQEGGVRAEIDENVRHEHDELGKVETDGLSRKTRSKVKEVLDEVKPAQEEKKRDAEQHSDDKFKFKKSVNKSAEDDSRNDDEVRSTHGHLNLRPRRNKRTVGYAEESDCEDYILYDVAASKRNPEASHKTDQPIASKTTANRNTNISAVGVSDRKDETLETSQSNIENSNPDVSSNSQKPMRKRGRPSTKKVDVPAEQTAAEPSVILGEATNNTEDPSLNEEKANALSKESEANDSLTSERRVEKGSGSRKGRGKKSGREEDPERDNAYGTADGRKTRKSSKHKRDQNKQPAETEHSKAIDNDESAASCADLEHERRSPELRQIGLELTSAEIASTSRQSEVHEYAEDESRKVSDLADDVRQAAIGGGVDLGEDVVKDNLTREGRSGVSLVSGRVSSETLIETKERASDDAEERSESMERSGGTHESDKKVEIIVETENVTDEPASSCLPDEPSLQSTSNLEKLAQESEVEKEEASNFASVPETTEEVCRVEDSDSKASEFDSDDDSLHADEAADVDKLLSDSESRRPTRSQPSSDDEESLCVEKTSDLNREEAIENSPPTKTRTDDISDDDASGVSGIDNANVSDYESSLKEACTGNNDKDKDKRRRQSDEPKITGIVQQMPNLAEQQQQQRTLAKRIPRARKSANKEGHRKSRASRGKSKKSRSKIAGLSSDSEASENGDRIDARNKSKIVKSVFGRVFGGEKTDKVKEVLNDWVSKSEDDSDGYESGNEINSTYRRDVEASAEGERGRRKKVSKHGSSRNYKKYWTESAKDKSSDEEVDGDRERGQEKQRREKSSSKIARRRENRTPNNNHASYGYEDATQSNSRCRQSKKKAEERISRAFNLSPIPGDLESINKAAKSAKDKDSSYELRNQSKSDLTKDVAKLFDDDLEQPEEHDVKRRKFSGKSKKRSDGCWSDLSEKQAKSRKSEIETDPADDFQRNVSKAENSGPAPVEQESACSRPCSSLAGSSARNRSPSADRNSQTSQNSENEDDEQQGNDVEEEHESECRRLSPIYGRGTSDSSVDNSSNSENEDEDNEEEKDAGKGRTSRKRSSSEFSGEKVVIRSPSSHSRAEVVTIAPTDAIEDNALDVPQEIEPTKPRQGKVLNFDEELFVECCSRLKATTENELRGAKKIKLDHSEGYHRKDEQQQGFRNTRDRWRDVESQNSLGSLLESVNQLLGEEMYSTRERDYATRSARNLRSEHSSRSASPDVSHSENIGYEDSLDVAFEHNNKLRDKIQQRMRESENLIASTFGSQKTGSDLAGYQQQQRRKCEQDGMERGSYAHVNEQVNVSNGEYEQTHPRNVLHDDHQSKIHLDSSGFKTKMNSALGSLLDKALSNLLHNNGKHDHNGSTPMKVLAELACARAPTATSQDDTPVLRDNKSQHPRITATAKEASSQDYPSPVSLASKDVQAKKPRNPIKELFERKKELNERKQQERSKAEAALRELNVQRQRKTKKTKKRQEFPLIRRSEHGGMAEKKRRRDGIDRKTELTPERIKDVYEFDEEESQIEPTLGSVMSYRNRVDKSYEVSCVRTKEVDVADLMAKTIGDTLENGKSSGPALGVRLESMIERKFKEIEKFAPKTKGALKSFQSEDQSRVTRGPMDDFVERKQRSKKTDEEPAAPQQQQQHNQQHQSQHVSRLKLKKRSKSGKKKPRNAWYENDSSDEYRKAIKKEDIGVGISKSQRTCSKGKQNLFAELSTSSESEFEENDADYEVKKHHRRAKKSAKKAIEMEESRARDQEQYEGTTEAQEDVEDNEWRDQDLKDNGCKNDSDNKKSESEMSDHPLVIDERKEPDDQRNTEDEGDNQSERGFELDDLYREDSSVADSDVDETARAEEANAREESRPRSRTSLREEKDVNETKIDYPNDDELIPLEEALDLLDRPEALQAKPEKHKEAEVVVKEIATLDIRETNDALSLSNESKEKSLGQEKELEPEVEQEEDQDEEQYEEDQDDDIPELPEKLSSNEKPQKEADNLPLHVFLSRKVQESKKRKQQQLKKLQEEQQRILMDFPPARRQRKCAIGKQGLLAEISSSDEEVYTKDTVKRNERSDHDRPRKKRESKEKRKERYLEKKHEQIIAKEQKAIEEEILRELEKKKEAQNSSDGDDNDISRGNDEECESLTDSKSIQGDVFPRKKHQARDKQKKQRDDKDESKDDEEHLSEPEQNAEQASGVHHSSISDPNSTDTAKNLDAPTKPRKPKSPTKKKTPAKQEGKVSSSAKKGKNPNNDRQKNRSLSSNGKDSKERRSSSGRRDSDDEELKTTKSWNKVEEGVGVAIGRRKRAAANQLYYWSSSSDEEEVIEPAPVVEEEEDDRQEQHGWIVGDSHKRMITMLAMEKQLKEKRRRSEDEFEPSRTKNKKHRNSTS